MNLCPYYNPLYTWMIPWSFHLDRHTHTNPSTICSVKLLLSNCHFSFLSLAQHDRYNYLLWTVLQNWCKSNKTQRSLHISGARCTSSYLTNSSEDLDVAREADPLFMIHDFLFMILENGRSIKKNKHLSYESLNCIAIYTTFSWANLHLRHFWDKLIHSDLHISLFTL